MSVSVSVNDVGSNVIENLLFVIAIQKKGTCTQNVVDNDADDD